MPNVPHVVAVRCHFCSKERPEWRIHRITRAQAICDYCLAWHFHALSFAAGKEAPRGCQVCELTWEQLRDLTPGNQVRLYCVPKDGIYQLLCRSCADAYLPKRGDLYRGTEFGEHLKL